MCGYVSNGHRYVMTAFGLGRCTSCWIVWSARITLLISLSMAMLNLATLLVTERLVFAKFSAMQHAVATSGVGASAGSLSASSSCARLRFSLRCSACYLKLWGTFNCVRSPAVYCRCSKLDRMLQVCLDECSFAGMLRVRARVLVGMCVVA